MYKPASEKIIVTRPNRYLPATITAVPLENTSRCRMPWMSPQIHRRRWVMKSLMFHGDVSSAYWWNQPQLKPALAAFRPNTRSSDAKAGQSQVTARSAAPVTVRPSPCTCSGRPTMPWKTAQYTRHACVRRSSAWLARKWPTGRTPYSVLGAVMPFADVVVRLERSLDVIPGRGHVVVVEQDLDVGPVEVLGGADLPGVLQGPGLALRPGGEVGANSQHHVRQRVAVVLAGLGDDPDLVGHRQPVLADLADHLVDPLLLAAGRRDLDDHAAELAGRCGPELIAVVQLTGGQHRQFEQRHHPDGVDDVLHTGPAEQQALAPTRLTREVRPDRGAGHGDRHSRHRGDEDNALDPRPAAGPRGRVAWPGRAAWLGVGRLRQERGHRVAPARLRGSRRIACMR